MFTAPHPASANHPPAPPAGQAQPAQGAAPTTSAHLLSLVQTLIAFGRALARTLADHPSAQMLQGFTRVFGSRDLALIMARIMRGLRLAEALQQRLICNASQIDNPRLRLYVPRPPTRPTSPRPTSTPRAEADPAATAPRDDDQDLLSRLPTVEEIAEQIRRRPIGAVLADICRDLGISTAHPAWREIFLAVGIHRGNVVRLLQDMVPRIGAPLLLRATLPEPQTTPVGPTPATGPPLPA